VAGVKAAGKLRDETPKASARLDVEAGEWALALVLVWLFADFD